MSDDIYCDQIIPGLLPVKVLFETELIMAFHHTKPYWEHHVVIIPKEHIESLASYPDNGQLDRELLDTIRKVTRLFEKEYGGCRISSNIGNYQTSKHLHFYVHYGKRIVTQSETIDHQ